MRESEAILAQNCALHGKQLKASRSLVDMGRPRVRFSVAAAAAEAARAAKAGTRAAARAEAERKQQDAVKATGKRPDTEANINCAQQAKSRRLDELWYSWRRDASSRAAAATTTTTTTTATERYHMRRDARSRETAAVLEIQGEKGQGQGDKVQG